jgi:hypothetical protein
MPTYDKMPSIVKSPRRNAGTHRNTTLDLDSRMPVLAKDIIKRIT